MTSFGKISRNPWPQSLSSAKHKANEASTARDKSRTELEPGESPRSFESLSSSKHKANEASTARDKSRVEFEPRESPQSFVGNDKPKLENAFQDTGRQPMDTSREFSTHPKASEHTPEYKEQVRGGTQERDKLSQPSESVRPRQSNATNHATTQQHTTAPEGHSAAEYYEDAKEHLYPSPASRTLRHAHHEASSESAHSVRRDVEDLSPLPPEHKKPKHSDPAQSNAATSDVTSSHTTELNKRYEYLSKEYEHVRGELQAKRQHLKEKDYVIGSLRADIVALQRSYDKQSTALTVARDELRSCQSQLDNVQRFISTADAHADQDIIQMLQELNEEVYQMSMTMADNVAEGFVRQSATARQTKEHPSVGEHVLAAIGPTMVNALAAVEGAEDIAMLLQIAFQGYLSHLLYRIVSSWTVDLSHDAFIEGTYQRLRKAETQAVSGHWRSLTRTHILPTPVSDPKVVVKYTMAQLFHIVMAAGLVSPQSDAASKLTSELSEKMLSIVSHVGRFSDMVSGMISGDFEIFTVQPGATFDEESMADMNEDQGTQRGTQAAQIVLCGSRMGLRKRTDEKIITLTKAQVVLKSFLG